MEEYVRRVSSLQAGCDYTAGLWKAASGERKKTGATALSLGAALVFGLSLQGPLAAQQLDFGFWLDRSGSMALDASGAVYVTGEPRSGADFDPGPGVVELTGAIFLAKYTPTGALAWVFALDGDHETESRAVAVEPSGVSYMTGSFRGSVDFDPGPGVSELTSVFGENGMQGDAFVAKYTAAGALLWAFSLGGPEADGHFDVSVDGSGAFFVGGSFHGTVDFDPGPGVLELTSGETTGTSVAKYDTNGGLLWAFSLPARIDSEFSALGRIATDPSGEVSVIGGLRTTLDVDPGSPVVEVTGTIFVARYDASGNLLWAFSPEGEGFAASKDIATDPSGAVYITGGGDRTLDFDPGPGVRELTEGFTAKYDASGNLLWAFSIGGSSIAVDLSGNAYLTGGLGGTVDFDPGPGWLPLTSQGKGDAFVAKYDTSGNLVWAFSAGAESSVWNEGKVVEVDLSGNAWLGGYCEIRVDLDPGPGEFELEGYGNYLARYVPGNVGPTCHARGPYFTDWQGATTDVALDGTYSYDPNLDAMAYSWTSDCPGAIFDDSTSATPLMSVDSPEASLPFECAVTLTVMDEEESDTCSARVRIEKTLPATLTLVNDGRHDSLGDAARLTPLDGRLVFTTFSWNCDDWQYWCSWGDLWTSDGTAEGTYRFQELEMVGWPDGVADRPFTALGNTLYLSFLQSGYNTPCELWKTDGTEEGTEVVKSYPDAWHPPPFEAPMATLGGTLFFLADAGHGVEPWVTDGTAEGTTLLKDILPGEESSLSRPNFTAAGQAIFFQANDGVHGEELWISDGTEEGTALVKDIAAGEAVSWPSDLTPVGDVLFFTADDRVHGRELWKSDGTTEGTSLVRDIFPGEEASSCRYLTAVGDALFFGADDGVHGGDPQLWKSDGTTEGTNVVKDLWTGPLLTALGGRLFFNGSSDEGRGLWTSDGTEEGTVLLSAGYIGNLTAAGRRLFFTNDDGVHGSELWTSDGTAEGTVLAADVYRGPESSWPGRLTAVGDTLYFTADDGVHGRELWSIAVVPPDLVLPGDCNSDGWVDISDASCILTYLFVDRSARLPCGDGSREEESNRLLLSWNGVDAEVDLSAVVRLLGHLFLGGPEHALGAECVPIAGCPVACQTGM